jgi:hypothetical protein
LAADEQRMGVFKDCLAALAAKFGNEQVDIDTTVGEPEQLTRCYGTWNRKFPEEPGRPCRQSKLLYVPEPWSSVASAKLDLLAAEAPLEVVPVRKGTGGSYPKTVESFDRCHYMDFNHLEVAGDEFTRKGVHYVPLTECPMTGRTHRGSNEVTCLTYADDGGFGFSCLNVAECEQ